MNAESSFIEWDGKILYILPEFPRELPETVLEDNYIEYLIILLWNKENSSCSVGDRIWIIYFFTTVQEILCEQKDSPFLARNQRVKRQGQEDHSMDSKRHQDQSAVTPLACHHTSLKKHHTQM